MMGLKLDPTLNVSTLLTIVAMVGGAAFYIVDKVDTLAEVVADQKTMSQQISDIQREILINRQETLKNRQVYIEGEK